MSKTSSSSLISVGSEFNNSKFSTMSAPTVDILKPKTKRVDTDSVDALASYKKSKHTMDSLSSYKASQMYDKLRGVLRTKRN